MKKIFKKSEKGSITIITLTTILFMIAFLVSTYAIIANRRQAQEQMKRETKELYEAEMQDISAVYDELDAIYQEKNALRFIVNIPSVTHTSWTQSVTATNRSLTGYTITYYYSTISQDDENPTSTTNTSISCNEATTYYVWAIARKEGEEDVKSTNYCVVKTGHTHTGSMLEEGGCYTEPVTCTGFLRRRAYSNDLWNVTYTGDEEVETKRCVLISYNNLNSAEDLEAGFSYTTSGTGTWYCNVCGLKLSEKRYSIAKGQYVYARCLLCGASKGGNRSDNPHFICTTCWIFRQASTDDYPVNNLGTYKYGFDAAQNGINRSHTATTLTWTVTHNTIYAETCGKNAANPSYKSYDF